MNTLGTTGNPASEEAPWAAAIPPLTARLREAGSLGLNQGILASSLGKDRAMAPAALAAMEAAGLVVSVPIGAAANLPGRPGRRWFIVVRGGDAA